MSQVLLLSGGIDSAALAAWRRPNYCLFIDYGQVPADAERSAAERVAGLLELRLHAERADCRAFGAGPLAGGEAIDMDVPEAWPLRNQLLVTLAAAHVVRTLGTGTILIGTVRSDRERHRDGTPEFIEGLSRVLESQADVTLKAPAINLTSAELVRQSGVSPDVIGWTHSCFRVPPCGTCAGCIQRVSVLNAVFG